MDEPTSGLDARAATIVMRTVRNTVDTGRTIVCTYTLTRANDKVVEKVRQLEEAGAEFDEDMVFEEVMRGGLMKKKDKNGFWIGSSLKGRSLKEMAAYKATSQKEIDLARVEAKEANIEAKKSKAEVDELREKYDKLVSQQSEMTTQLERLTSIVLTIQPSEMSPAKIFLLLFLRKSKT